MAEPLVREREKERARVCEGVGVGAVVFVCVEAS